MALRLLIRRAVQSRPIPLALVLTSFEPGGTERQMTELIRRLDPARFRVHVACFHKSGAWLSRVEDAAVEVREFPLHSFRSWAAAGAFAQYVQWLRQRQIAIVHACDLYANVFALPGAAMARVPVRLGSRRELSPPDKTRAHLAAQRTAYRFAHRVVANSQAAASRLREEGVWPGRITVIPNGIDLGRVAERQERHPRSLTISTVANLRPEKGHDVLLRAAARVLRREPDVRFRFIGSGPLCQSLRALAHDLGVADAVAFLGHCEDVPALLSASDLFVLPSRTEASPNALIEAMAAGLPVVASATGGIPELIDDRANGVLVPVGDDRALAAAILELIDQPGLALTLGRAARLTVHLRYSFERMVGAFEQMYAAELAARGRVMPRVRQRVA